MICLLGRGDASPRAALKSAAVTALRLACLRKY